MPTDAGTARTRAPRWKYVTCWFSVALEPLEWLHSLATVRGTVRGSERLPYKQEVGGSSPSAPTTTSTTYSPRFGGDPLPIAGSSSLPVTFLGPRALARLNFPEVAK